MTASDLVDALVGYRAWRSRGDGLLEPWTAVRNGPWLPGMNTAVCHAARRPSSDHRPPVAGCSCGIYALADLRDPRLHGGGDQVVGAIAAWGDVELHRTGFRAEHAQIVGLALPWGAARETEAVAAAARHYGVDAVAWDELPGLARRFGMPLDPRLIRPPGRSETPLGAPGEVGIAFHEHVWAVARRDHVETGLTSSFRGLLATDAEVTLPPAGTVVAAGDPLAMISSRGTSLIAWACLSGTVLERYERIDGPWLARVAPTSWVRDSRAFAWGRAAEVQYRAWVDEARRGVDVFADLRASRVVAEAPVRGPGDVLAELARRRARPRFADANEVYAACAEPVNERIAGDGRHATLAARADVVVRYAIAEPAATITLVARPRDVRLVCGRCELEPDVELSMSAGTAAEYFAGRVDIARALRSGEIAANVPIPTALRVSSLVKDLLSDPAARHRPNGRR